MSKFKWLFGVVLLPLAFAALCAVPARAADEVVAAVEVDADGVATDAGEAYEDAHAHPKAPLLNFDIGAAIWNLLIFGVTFALLAFFVWPPILKGLQAREEQIRTDLEGAQQARVAAQASQAQLDQQISDAQGQVQAMLAEARRDAEVAGQRIVEEAKAEAERQRTRAIADIETAKKVALSEMAGQTSEIAMTLAKQVVGRELKPDDHAELIRQSLERLPSRN
ncbi:F0F1 ATP synthase subunit B [Roseimaritima sediminicola]|uniref:F0F1 ATP synthase subunit B n=1 Tax=Roseimaritima sediminicola TaxID=2662066 RepID=UPI00129832C1|nr:F0F1 ATP synthase subunit B [Roseimaritima sediminicola]